MVSFDWTPKIHSTCYQSTDIYSAPSQDFSNPHTLSSKSSSNTPESQCFHSHVNKFGTVVLDLSSLGPTLREVNSTEVSVSQVEDSNVAIAAKNGKDKICKSRLPVRACSNKLWNQRQQRFKRKPIEEKSVGQCGVHVVGKRLDPFENEFPKSKIPVMMGAKYPSQVSRDQRRVRPRTFTAKGISEPSKSSTEHRHGLTNSPGRRSTKEMRRKSTEVTKRLRTNTNASQVACAWDQSVVMQTETIEGKTVAKDGEENQSLSITRNTSLCRASRGPCPSRTSTSTSTTTSTPSTSPRDVRAEGEQASSQRMRSKRKSSRTLGKKEQEQEEEGNEGDHPITAPVTENQTSL